MTMITAIWQVVIADHLRDQVLDVTFVSTASIVSPFTTFTLEQDRVQRSLVAAGVELVLSTKLTGIGSDHVRVENIYGGPGRDMACRSLVLVTSREPKRGLQNGLRVHTSELNIEVIGDALAPGLIADATFTGHLAARNFEGNGQDIEAALFQREMPHLPR